MFCSGFSMQKKSVLTSDNKKYVDNRGYSVNRESSQPLLKRQGESWKTLPTKGWSNLLPIDQAPLLAPFQGSGAVNAFACLAWLGISNSPGRVSASAQAQAHAGAGVKSCWKTWMKRPDLRRSDVESGHHDSHRAATRQLSSCFRICWVSCLFIFSLSVNIEIIGMCINMEEIDECVPFSLFLTILLLLLLIYFFGEHRPRGIS